MIKIDTISKHFGDKTVLKNISFALGSNEIVGLIGDNGVGKTTLFKIILKDIEADEGTVEIQKEVFGYLPQNPQFPPNMTVNQFLTNKVGEKEYKINKVLDQVGLSALDRTTQVKKLSGGQKTRIYLVSLLLSDPKPTTLLLDEPTNNLDIEGIECLEEFLTTFKGIVFLISHDRTLLDNVAEKIIELDGGKIKIYGGNYSFYRKQKEIEKKAYERMYIAQEKKVAQIEGNIKQMQEKASSGEKQFSSGMPYQRRKIKKSAEQAVHRKEKLEKFLKSEKRLEKPEGKIKYFIQLAGKTNSDKTLMYAKNIIKTFNGKIILNNISFHIRGNERIWLAGLNGSGKTTLLKILINEIKKDSGQIEYGNNVNIGYFSQDRQDLNPENTLLDEFVNIGLSLTEGYKLAIKFYFKRNELVKQIKELSMGQKAKVVFAKLTTGNYQLLILDEPTNHLEIRTREILEEALSNYQGGILVSSHDRFFLEKIGINRIVILKEGKLTVG